MKTSELEKTLKERDSRIEIVPNPNRTAFEQKCGQGLSNVKLDGRDICPCPSDEIREYPDASYYYVFPNGSIAPHNSVEDVMDRVEKVLKYIKTEEGKEVFFSKE